VTKIDKQQKHGSGVSDVQSLYLNRLRASKEKVCIGLDADCWFNNAVILAFDMYTILVEAPVCIKSSGNEEIRQILLYKNHIRAILPENKYIPILMDKFNAGRKGSGDD